MGIDLGVVEATLKLQDQFSSILSAAGSNLSDFLKQVIDTASKSKDGNDKLESSYLRLAASLDPVIASEQKLEKAHQTLDAALQKGLIDQDKYNQLLDKAKEKYEAASQGGSVFSTIIGKLGGLAGEGGELMAKLTEHVAGLGEKLESLGSEGESANGVISTLMAGFVDFIPLLIAAAAAIVGVGVAWKAFDFLKDAIEEGAKTEQVVVQLNNALINNGAAAGYSAAELIDQAEALALSTGQSKEAIIAGETMMVRFGSLTNDTFPKFRQAAIDFAIATKTDLVTAFETLARASEDSGRGMMALKSVGVILNTQQKAHMKDLIDSGHVVEYQNELLGILASKIGGVGDAYGRTLTGGIGSGKQALALFGETIASYVIPTLEDLGTSLIKELGHSNDLKTAWHNIGEEIKDAGTKIGIFIHDYILLVGIKFEELRLKIDDARLSFLKFKQDMTTVKIAGVSIGIGDDELSKIKDVEKDISKALLEYTKLVHMAAQKPVQALAGDPNVIPKKPDPVKGIKGKAKAIKSSASAMAEWDKVVQAFNNHITDTNSKLDEQISEQEALQRSLAKGLEAYGLEEQQQKRNAVVFAAVSKADQEYRTEVEKLTEIIHKLHEAHDTKDEQEKTAALTLLQASYEGTRLAIQGKAAAEVDAKAKTTDTLTQTKELTAEEQLRAKLEAEIADALNGTVVATEAAGKALAVYQAGVKASLTTNAEGIKQAKDRAAADYDLTRQDEKLLKVAKEYGDLQKQVNLGTLQAQIDTGLSERLQVIQATFLDKLTQGGELTVEAGIELFRKMAGGDEEILKRFLATMQDDIGTLFDQAQAKKIAGISKNPFDVHEQQQAEYQHLADIAKTESQRNDAYKAMADASATFWAGEVNTWKTAIDNLAKLGGKVGSIFSAIGEALGAIQQAQSTGASISNAVTASKIGGDNNSSIAAAAGVIGMVVAIFAEIYSAVDAHIKKTESETYGTGNSAVNIVHGDIGITYLDNEGMKVADEIKKLVKQFGDALGGTITDLDSIGVQIRNDGKYVASYVKDHFIGHFASVDEAIQAALEYELQTGALKLKGMSDLVLQGIKSFTQSDFNAETQFLNQLKQIDDLAKSQGQIGLETTVHGLNDLFDALSQMKDATPAVVQGFLNIANAEDAAWRQWSDSITGRKESAAELLAIKQQEGEMFNAERQMRLAQLALEKIDLQQQLALLQAKAGMIIGTGGTGVFSGGSPGQGTPTPATRSVSYQSAQLTATAQFEQAMAQLAQTDIQIKSNYLKAQEGLIPAQATIYDAQIGMIEAEIDAISKIIANMPAAIDIPSIRLPNVGGAAGKTPAQQLDQQLKDIIAGGLNPAAKALYDYQKQLADLADQYKHNKVSAADYAAALAELKKEFQANLLATAKGYAGTGMDSFAQKLSDGQKFFADLEKMGKGKSGIPDWLEKVMKGQFLDEMRKDWQSRVDAFRGMTNPMASISATSKTLMDDLHALAVATGMTAAQVKAAEAEIAQGAEYQRVNAVNGILDTLFGYLQNDASYAGQAAELKREELQIQFTIYEYQLKALNAWSDVIAKLFHDAEAAALVAASVSTTIVQAAQTISTSATNLSNSLDSLLQFYNSLNQGASSGLTIDQQYQAAKSTYSLLLSQIQHGDKSHIADLSGDAQALVSLMGQEFDTSTQGYADMRRQILMDLAPILQAGGLTPPPILGTIPTSGGSNSTLTTSAQLMASSSSDISSSLQQMNVNQSSIADAAQSLAASADSIRLALLAGSAQHLVNQIRFNPS